MHCQYLNYSLIFSYYPISSTCIALYLCKTKQFIFLYSCEETQWCLFVQSMAAFSQFCSLREHRHNLSRPGRRKIQVVLYHQNEMNTCIVTSIYLILLCTSVVYPIPFITYGWARNTR